MQKKIHWTFHKIILEKDNLVTYLKNISSELLQLNIHVSFFDFDILKHISKGNGFSFFDINDNQIEPNILFRESIVVPHGSISAIEKIISVFNKQEIEYEIFYDSEQFKYSKYYCLIPKEFRLNDNFIMLNFNILLENIEKIIKDFKDNSFFLRPNSCKKTFTGLVINKENYLFELSFLKNNRGIENDIVCLADKKNIKSEYRFFVCENKIISNATYMIDGEINEDKSIYNNSEDLLSFVKKFIAKFDYIDTYVVDVAETPDGFKIIELNAVSTSGFYNSDIKNIIKEISSCVRHYF